MQQQVSDDAALELFFLAAQGRGFAKSFGPKFSRQAIKAVGGKGLEQMNLAFCELLLVE